MTPLCDAPDVAVRGVDGVEKVAGAYFSGARRLLRS